MKNVMLAPTTVLTTVMVISHMHVDVQALMMTVIVSMTTIRFCVDDGNVGYGVVYDEY